MNFERGTRSSCSGTAPAGGLGVLAAGKLSGSTLGSSGLTCQWGAPYHCITSAAVKVLEAGLIGCVRDTHVLVPRYKRPSGNLAVDDMVRTCRLA